MSRSEHSSHSIAQFIRIEDSDAKTGISSSVLQAVRSFKDSQQPFELMVTLAYALCLEMGFVPAGDDARLLAPPSSPTEHRTCWSYSYVNSIVTTYATAAPRLIELQQQEQQHRCAPQNDDGDGDSCKRSRPSTHENSYRFTLKLINFSQRECLLLARPLFQGNAICLSLCSDNCTGQSVVLPISRYIHMTMPQVDDGATVSTSEPTIEMPTTKQLIHLLNIKEFSHKLKSALLLPIRNELMSIEGHRYAALDGLPQEMLWLLSDHLNAIELQNFSCVNMKMRVRILDYIERKGRQISVVERRHVQRVPYVERRLPRIGPYNLRYFEFL